MSNIKLVAGHLFPDITLNTLAEKQIQLSKPSADFNWRMVVVYRGQHCPICTKYLSTLNQLLPEFNAIGVDVIAISSDPKEKVEAHLGDMNLNFDLGFGLTIEQMQTLGLYVSHPRSEQETDRPFSEPAVFVINDKEELQAVDISNAPFARPELNSLLMGLQFIRDPKNNYPIRGTYA